MSFTFHKANSSKDNCSLCKSHDYFKANLSGFGMQGLDWPAGITFPICILNQEGLVQGAT